MAVSTSLEIKNLQVKNHQAFSLEIESLTLRTGDMVALVGESGSGKTTLIESIISLRNREAGQIHFSSKRIPLSTDCLALRQRLGVQLCKSTYPEHYTVRDLVQLHQLCYPKSCHLVYQVLAIGQLAGFRYGNLSRGQRQRVDLFMAMAHSPDILLLDEPSTGLDQCFQRQFFKLLTSRKLHPRKTTLMCSAFEQEVALCNRIITMNDGRVELDQQGELCGQNWRSYRQKGRVSTNTQNLLEREELAMLLNKLH